MNLKKNVSVFLFLLLAINSLFAKDVAKPKLMLAKVYHQGINLDEYWVSEKYDGVRAIWDGQQLISRGGNIYYAPNWFIQDFPAMQLDGELWIARKKFEQVVSTVRDKAPNDNAWKHVKFMVFDLPDNPQNFNKRLLQLQTQIADKKIPWLLPVKQWKVNRHELLMEQLDEITTAGAEGLMLHRGLSFYKSKRNGDLLKVKPYQDAEAIVVKHLKGKGKNSQRLGAIIVRMPSGLQFKIGSGFSDEERHNPPAIGSTITYQYHGVTKNGVPRFATFLRIRKLEK